MKKRINPKTQKEQIWLQPKGKPGIWVDRGFCLRCKPFGECLGLIEMDESDWNELKRKITRGDKKITEIRSTVENFFKPCS